MRAVDTSVIVAAFAPWHESHDRAFSAVTTRTFAIAHCALESYSTLTRLPEPFRAPAEVVAEFLRRRFGTRWIHPSPTTAFELPERLAATGIAGGATYDALVAATAAEHGAELCSLDVRAESVYRRLGVDYVLLT